MFLVIHFGGTGQKGLEKRADVDIDQFFSNEKINFINVSGCQHEDVCNNTVFPNLQEYAGRFCNAFFSKDEDSLYCHKRTAADLNSLNLGIRVDELTYKDKGKDKIIAKSIINNLDDKIEGIILTGHSRGAVIAFEVARKLKELSSETPVYCVADQPVPGNYYVGPGTNAHRNIDLRDLDNIKEMSLIYGVYNKGRPYHSLFHRQIVPRLNSKTKRAITAIPRADHWGGNPKFSCYLHYFQKLANVLLPLELIDNNMRDSINNYIDFYYQDHDCSYVAKDNKLEEIGGNRLMGGLYAHLDKSNHKNIVAGFEYDSKKYTNLGEWFMDNVAALSKSKTKDTFELIRVAKNCNYNEINKLIELYGHVERWLIRKDGSYSSRYDAMIAFRRHIYNSILQKSESVDNTKVELQRIAGDIRKKENYLFTMWNRESRRLSFLRSNETKILDEAFKKYSLGAISDNDLRNSLDTWLDNKNKSNSKRYDLVYEIREILGAVDNTVTFTIH